VRSIVPDVSDTTRIKEATLAALVAVMCAGCGSTTTVSARPITPVSVDCGLQAPSPRGVEGVFAEIAGVTVSEVCPADVDPTFASQEFDGLAAGLVSQNGPLTSNGYVYSEGPTVAYVAPGSPPATVEDALTQILDNVG
jgi:ribosomal protein S27E